MALNFERKGKHHQYGMMLHCTQATLFLLQRMILEDGVEMTQRRWEASRA
jgi:hypothetical protein